MTTIETGNLKHESMYVQRREIEVPRTSEDDDISIVEDPNVART